MKSATASKTLALTALTVTALLAVSACGGGSGSANPPPAGSATPTPTPVPTPTISPSPSPSGTPTPVGNALNGKTLYAANCHSCHGVDPTQNIAVMKAAGSSSVILSAISRNLGGMRTLGTANGGPIGPTQANDIAAYLANP